MDFKSEFKNLVKIVKDVAKLAGEPLRNEDIAKRLGVSRTYLSDLLGAHGEVTEKHIGLFKERFKSELSLAIRHDSDKRADPLRAMLIAFLVDYTEKEAKREGITPSQLRARIRQRADLIQGGLEFGEWMSDFSG